MGLRLFDERGSGDLVAIVDFGGDVVVHGGSDDLASPVRGL